MLPDIYEMIWKDLNLELNKLRQQIATLTLRAGQSQTTLGLVPLTVANLPSTNNTGGDLYFATNGRKSGEGAGLGTGTVVFWNSATSQWMRITDNTQVVS